MFSLNVKPTAEPFPISSCIADVQLEKVVYVKDDNGGRSFDFYYGIKGTGASLRDKRFPPNKEIPETWVRKDENYKQALKRVQDDSMRVLLHIISKFVDEAETKVAQSEDFDVVAESYCDLLNANCKGVDLYMKTVINAKRYVSVPRAGRFLQNMSEGPCTLSYTEKELELIRNNSKNEGIMVEGQTDEVDA